METLEREKVFCFFFSKKKRFLFLKKKKQKNFIHSCGTSRGV